CRCPSGCRRSSSAATCTTGARSWARPCWWVCRSRSSTTSSSTGSSRASRAAPGSNGGHPEGGATPAPPSRLCWRWLIVPCGLLDRIRTPGVANVENDVLHRLVGPIGVIVPPAAIVHERLPGRVVLRAHDPDRTRLVLGRQDA